MIIYAGGLGGWTGAVYLDAWQAGGQRAGYMGFPHGQFSYPDALFNAAGLTVAVVGLEWWRRRRAARAQATMSPDGCNRPGNAGDRLARSGDRLGAK